MAPFLFEIIADFKMQAGSAILQSKRVQQALDGVSGSAERALGAVNQLGVGLVSSLGIGSISALGGFAKSVAIAEKFTHTVTTLSSVITSNLEVFEGTFFDKFNNRVLYSQQLIKELSAEANRLGVREATLFNTFKSIGFIGLQGGLQMEEIKKLASNVQLAAPVTGLDPNLVGDQLFRLALQGVGGSPRLFKTLLADTQTFERFKGRGGVREFGQMGFAERVQLIAQAFEEFGNRPEIVARQVRTLSGQMNIFRNQVVGLNGVMRETGQILQNVLISAMVDINGLVQKVLVPVFDNFRDVLARLADKPIEIIKDLQQLAGLRMDVNVVSGILRLTANILIFSGLLGLLSKTFLTNVAILGPLIGILNTVFGTISNFIIGLTVGNTAAISAAFGAAAGFGKVIVALKLLVGLLARLVGFILVVTLALQVFRRALFEFKINIAKFMADNAERISSALARIQGAFQVLFRPIQAFIEVMGKLLGFSIITGLLVKGFVVLLDVMAWIMEIFAKGIVVINALAAALGTFFGGLFAISQFMLKGNFAAAKDVFTNLGADVSAAALAEIDKSGLFGKVGQEQPVVVPKVEHTGDVIINNDIKEAFEPDRIAFTITEQINKALTKPTVSAANSFNGFGTSKVFASE